MMTPAVPAPEPSGSALHPVYAGFLLRLMAFLLDFLCLIALLCTIVGLAVACFPSEQHFPSVIQGQPVNPVVVVLMSFMMSHPHVFLLVWTIVFILQWLYFALQESGLSQTTLGKRILGLRVTDLEGKRITFARATGRYFAKMLSLSIYIGGIMAAFMPRKQALHDLMAGTLVVKTL